MKCISLLGLGKAKGSIDASNLLKPALSRGELQCCGARFFHFICAHLLISGQATMLNEYRLIQEDAA